jgi:hypothetical protein
LAFSFVFPSRPSLNVSPFKTKNVKIGDSSAIRVQIGGSHQRQCLTNRLNHGPIAMAEGREYWAIAALMI